MTVLKEFSAILAQRSKFNIQNSAFKILKEFWHNIEILKEFWHNIEILKEFWDNIQKYRL